MRARRRTQIGRRVDNSDSDTGAIVRANGAQIAFSAGQPTISITTTATTSQAAITFTAGQPAIETVKHQTTTGAAITFTAGQPTVTIDNPATANKIFQLTPASIQQSGGSVTSWDDEIASYDFTPGTAPTVASAALNGYDVVDFDDTGSQFLASSYTPSGTLTILIVAKFTEYNDAGPGHHMFSSASFGDPDGGIVLSDGDYGGSSGPNYSYQTGVGGAWVSGAIYIGTSIDGAWHIVGVTVSSTRTRFIVDSVVYTDNAKGSIAAGAVLKLGSVDGASGTFTGQIAEVVYWDDDLDTDLSTEIAALQTKYGL